MCRRCGGGVDEPTSEEVEKFTKVAKVLQLAVGGAKLRAPCNAVVVTKAWYKAVAYGTIYCII